MEYRLPTLEDETILRDYLNEHFENGEDEVLLLQELFLTDFRGWIRRIRKNARRGSDGWGRSLLYLCFQEKRLVGILCVRFELPQELAEIYGHIGYGVRPSERRKGYATAILNLGKDICRHLGMTVVLVGCYKKNLASARVIEHCGGQFVSENDNYTRGVLSRYYEIVLGEAFGR